MRDFFNRSIPLNVAFCACYFLLAILGFQWGALTANATLLWPPSGLAAFACLVFGSRVLPGLLLGAILSSQSISLANLPENSALSYLIGLVNGSSSIFQAYIIARLSQTYYQQGFRVTTRSAFYFTLTVLVCCTIAATISNFMLWQADIVRAASAIQNWVVWWTGDTIGVFIITPLLLWIHHRKTFFQQSQENTFFIFSVGAGIVLLVAATVGHKERETFKTNLIHAADLVQLQLQSNVDLAIRDFTSLRNVDLQNEAQFRKQTELYLTSNSIVDSVSLINLRSDPASAENDSNHLSLKRSKEHSFEWNVESTPFETIVTPSNTKKQNNKVVYWVTAFNQEDSKITLETPIYICLTETEDCNTRYLMSAVFDLNKLMQSSIGNTALKEINIQLAISNESSTKTYLQWTKAQWTVVHNTNDLIQNPATNSSKKAPLIKVADSEWQLLIAPQNIPTQLIPTLLQCGILLIGFSLVTLLSAYLQALFKQDQLIIDNQKKLKEEINNQTEALRAANDWLLKEMDAKRITQEQLKASESHLRTLLDNIPDPVWLKSPEGSYISFNKAVTEMFFRQQHEVVGKSASDYVDKEFADAIMAFEAAALASNEAVRRDLWMHIPSKNEHRLMDTIKIAMRDQDNSPIGILSIARDITEQHKLINELEKFKRFAEFASEGFSIMSLTAETLYMNRSMQRMLLSNQNSSHNKFEKYFPEDLQEQWRENIFPYVLLKGFWQGELAALRSDNSRFPTKATFFAIRDDKGQPLYIGEIMSDISEQKLIEESLQLAKKTAEEATRAKSRFLANMSHEIRTPLNAVLGYSQLFMTDPHLSAQQQERMQSILSAGQRLLHLINDILDLSKIEAGVLHLRQDYFDLHQELNDIVSIMNAKAIAKGLALNSSIQLPNPAIVKSDRQKIGQVVLNLIGNAIKFTQTGAINLNVHIDKEEIYINITDTGPGISAQELQSLFSAFKQGKAGEDSGGTGLGLVISKHIAESLGGDITLTSESGKGTTAIFRLPLAIEYSATIEYSPLVANAKLAENESCSVLVVEDDPASRDLLVNLLRNMGCEVREAPTGKAGLAAAISRKPNIIFTDIRMPELTGTHMLKELRKTFSKNELPVVAVSASSLEHERNFYLAEGFHEFIGKPYQFSDIYNTLQKLTNVKFANTEQSEQPVELAEIERTAWSNPTELIELHMQLIQLKASLSSGDMSSSKKLFTLQTPQTIGRNSYQRIHNAIKQYDLVLAERFLDELLTEIDAALT